MKASTFHTYPALIIDGGRHAETQWGNHRIHATAAQAVVATLRHHPDAIISLAIDDYGSRLVGLMPGGLA